MGERKAPTPAPLSAKPPAPPAPPLKISSSQLDILDHTINRAANRLFNGDSADMQELIRLGLMRLAGRASYTPEPYFTITEEGVQAHARSQSPPSPEWLVFHRDTAEALIHLEAEIVRAKTAGKARYMAFLGSPYATFREFLRVVKVRRA